MTFLADISTIELSRTRLALRDDLRFTPQTYAGQAWCHVERTTTGQYFRLGWPEYVFVSLLNGRTTFAEVLATSSRISGAASLSMKAASDLYLWLLNNDVATVVEPQQSARTEAGGAAASAQRFGVSRFNPLWIRVPLGRPDGMLRALQPAFGWLLSPVALFAGILLAIAALLVLSNCWYTFADSASGIISSDNWIKLLLCGAGLKLFHEMGHGLACLRYGGTVREAGLVFALLIPLPYVDASAAWAFRSRWQRLHTALAGVQFELMIATVAMLSWPLVSDPFARQLLQNVVVMASSTTVLFNLNPLMRFDGYFVAADLMQIPNLQSESSSALRGMVLRILLGEQRVGIRSHRRGLLVSYAICSWLWRTSMVAALLIAASVLFHGAGLLLAVAGVLIWYVCPATQLLRECRQLWKNAPERLLRAGCIVASAMTGAWFLLWHVPVWYPVSVPGVLEFSGESPVRVSTPGFVESTLVRDGDQVMSGDAVAVLRNDEVEHSVYQLHRRIASERLKLHSARASQDGLSISITEENIAALTQELHAQRCRIDSLTLRADVDGTVVFQNKESQEGRWLPAGAQFLTIVQPDQKEVRISIAQCDLPDAVATCGLPVQVYLPSTGRIDGRLDEIDPQASHHLFSDALFAFNGGTLPSDAGVAESSRSGTEPRLAAQRFMGYVTLIEASQIPAGTGQKAMVRLGSSGHSMGFLLWQEINRQFRRNMQQPTLQP
jgi:putative peptide zinc metalloprotease protein